MSGYCAAAIAALIFASYPVATRAGVTGPFTPHELVTLRFGVGALLFLPYLMYHFRTIGRGVWLRGIPLTLFQGAGMGALVICGLELAPANHQAALGPGVVPAWVAVLGFLVFARKPSPRLIAGATLCVIGVLALAGWSFAGRNPAVLAGDAMFLAASALGALYVLQLRKWGVSASRDRLALLRAHRCALAPRLRHRASVARRRDTAAMAGPLAGRADRRSGFRSAQPFDRKARRRALERHVRAGPHPDGASRGLIPRRNAVKHRAGGDSLDHRRRFYRRFARLRGQTGFHERADEATGLRTVSSGITGEQRAGGKRGFQGP
jgi:hypothetical protein